MKRKFVVIIMFFLFAFLVGCTNRINENILDTKVDISEVSLTQSQIEFIETHEMIIEAYFYEDSIVFRSVDTNGDNYITRVSNEIEWFYGPFRVSNQDRVLFNEDFIEVFIGTSQYKRINYSGEIDIEVENYTSNLQMGSIDGEDVILALHLIDKISKTYQVRLYQKDETKVLFEYQDHISDAPDNRLVVSKNSIYSRSNFDTVHFIHYTNQEGDVINVVFKDFKLYNQFKIDEHAKYFDFFDRGVLIYYFDGSIEIRDFNENRIAYLNSDDINNYRYSDEESTKDKISFLNYNEYKEIAIYLDGKVEYNLEKEDLVNKFPIVVFDNEEKLMYRRDNEGRSLYYINKNEEELWKLAINKSNFYVESHLLVNEKFGIFMQDEKIVKIDMDGKVIKAVNGTCDKIIESAGNGFLCKQTENLTMYDYDLTKLWDYPVAVMTYILLTHRDDFIISQVNDKYAADRSLTYFNYFILSSDGEVVKELDGFAFIGHTIVRDNKTYIIGKENDGSWNYSRQMYILDEDYNLSESQRVIPFASSSFNYKYGFIEGDKLVLFTIQR